MKLLLLCLCQALYSIVLFAQPANDAPSVAAKTMPGSPAEVTKPMVIDKRVAGVLPNYRTADGTIPFVPITAKRKMTIAAKDSFDFPIYFMSSFFAGIGHVANQNPEFGQGVKGFSHRLATGFADQALGNLFAEGAIPALLREDPRYFRVGSGAGSGSKRLGYALTRIFVAKTDRNTLRMNFSELGGNAAATLVSNAYLPSQHNVPDNVQKFVTSIGTDAISNVIKEFWPDLKQKMAAKKAAKEAKRQ